MFPSSQRQSRRLHSAFMAMQPEAFRPEDEGEEDEEETDGDEEGNEGGTGASGEGAASGDVKDPDKKRLSEEAAKYRRQLREQQASTETLAKKLREYEDKDKSDLELAQREAKEAKEQLAAERKRIKEQAVELAFFQSGEASRFIDSSTALRLLDLKDVELDEEGLADTKKIKELAELLGKEKPFLLKNEEDLAAGTNEQVPSGSSTNGKRRSREEMNQAALIKKFPALGARG